MARHDEIDAQVNADWEFTRRAQQLMSKLRTLGTAGRSPEDPVQDEETERE
jgi:hypothetical protein